MEETEKNQQREEIFSIVVRAGKRTYFFDVKETRAKEKYLTITESKRRFNNDSGKFFYEKHKLFLYKEDFEKFSDGLKGVIDFVDSGVIPQETEMEMEESTATNVISEVSFEDLGDDIESLEPKDEM